jgi:hypothetical protein
MSSSTIAPTSAASACTKKCQCYINPCKKCQEDYDDCICFQGKYFYHFYCGTFEELQHCEFRHEILKEVRMLSYWIHKYQLFDERARRSDSWQYRLYVPEYEFARTLKHFSPRIVSMVKIMLSLIENEKQYAPELIIALFEYLVKNVAFVYKHKNFQKAIINKMNDFLSSQKTTIALEKVLLKHFNVTMHDSIIEWLALIYG